MSIRSQIRSWVRESDYRRYIVYLGFLLVLAFFATFGGNFLTSSNLATIGRQTAPISIMAVGTAYVLSAREIDLSIGAVVAVGALLSARTLESTGSIGLATLAGIGGGGLFGLFNGLVTVKGRIPSFLVTLGSLSIAAGLARLIAPLSGIPIRDDRFLFLFGSGHVGILSMLVVWTIVVAGIGHLIYHHTRYGRHVMATGGNVAAAQSVGINTDRIKISVLTLSGMSAGLAGMLYTGRLHIARYTHGGEGDLLSVIAAVVIGGTSLFGGRGSIIGAIAGSLILGMVNNGLVLMGLEVPVQQMVRGGIIIVAVLVSLRESREVRGD